MRKKKLSNSVVTISCLALIVGGFAVALVALRTTSLPKLLDIEVAAGFTTDPTANDELKAQLAQESSTLEAQKQQLSTTKAKVDAKEASVLSLEVRSKEDELDFTRAGKDIVFNFLQSSLQQRSQVASAIGEFRAELAGLSKLLDSVSIVKAKLAASEARFKAKEGEFKQALRQRLSVTKELALYFLTLKFV